MSPNFTYLVESHRFLQMAEIQKTGFSVRHCFIFPCHFSNVYVFRLLDFEFRSKSQETYRQAARRVIKFGFSMKSVLKRRNQCFSLPFASNRLAPLQRHLGATLPHFPVTVDGSDLTVSPGRVENGIPKFPVFLIF